MTVISDWLAVTANRIYSRRVFFEKCARNTFISLVGYAAFGVRPSVAQSRGPVYCTDCPHSTFFIESCYEIPGPLEYIGSCWTGDSCPTYCEFTCGPQCNSYYSSSSYNDFYRQIGGSHIKCVVMFQNGTENPCGSCGCSGTCGPCA